MTEGIEPPTEDARCRVAASLTPDSVLDVCREQLAGVEPRARGAWRDCRAIEALYHPERYVRVAYALLPDQAVPPERYWPDGQIVYLHWPVRLPMSRRGALVRINGHDVEAYCFPKDRRLHRLGSFARRASATRFLQSCVERAGPTPQIHGGTLRRALIRYVPEHKLVARVQARALQGHSDDAEHCTVVIRSASPQVCHVLARRHSAVAKLVGKASKHLYVPDLVGADPAGGLVAVEWVPGRSLLEKLRTSDFTAVMRRMARTLFRFHALPVSGLKHFSSLDSYRRAHDATSILTLACPELRARLTLLDSELGRRLEEWGEVESATLHNDMHWDQVCIRQRRYALLDLERMCTGDPLIDVANFAIQVRMLGHRPEYKVESTSARRWAHEFLEQWAAATRRPLAGERFHLQAAVALLKLAAAMVRHLRPGWRALAHRCVAEAEVELSLSNREVVGP